ncbi:MAG: thiamine pyrophosphate-dependent dehydrogenase E1 component subunit alpha [Chloroflexota bacterium]
MDRLRVYRDMVRTRVLDLRVSALSAQGRIGISSSCRGHEAAQVASAQAIQPGHDVVYPYYRDIGVVLALGITPRDILLGALDKAAEPFSGARQMPFHYSSRALRMPTPSTSIATQIPHAVGSALASRVRGEDAVTVVYFGDGASSKGDFHEAVNFASIHRLPVVFFCENNQYAISVPVRLQVAGEGVAARAAGYGIAGERLDGTDPAAVYQATQAAVDRARAGGGPTLLEAVVYRLGPHTSHDDDTRYRSREEVQRWEQRDPVRLFQEHLLEMGEIDPEADAALWQAARDEMERDLAEAETAEPPSAESAFLHVFADTVIPNPFTRERTAVHADGSPGVYSTGSGRDTP